VNPRNGRSLLLLFDTAKLLVNKDPPRRHDGHFKFSGFAVRMFSYPYRIPLQQRI